MRTVLIGTMLAGGVCAGLLTVGLDHSAARAVAATGLAVCAILLGMALEHLYPTPRRTR